MGDVLTLIEKAQESFDQKQAAETAKRMMAGKLTLTDFYDQLQKMKNMGSMEEMLGMLPGVVGKSPRRREDRRKADGAHRSHHPVYDPEGEG